MCEDPAESFLYIYSFRCWFEGGRSFFFSFCISFPSGVWEGHLNRQNEYKQPPGDKRKLPDSLCRSDNHRQKKKKVIMWRRWSGRFAKHKERWRFHFVSITIKQWSSTHHVFSNQNMGTQKKKLWNNKIHKEKTLSWRKFETSSEIK